MYVSIKRLKRHVDLDGLTPEQICEVIALACEPPSENGRPFTHWTHAALASAAVECGIVDEPKLPSFQR